MGDGISTCISLHNIDVPCNLARLSLVLFPHVCLRIYVNECGRSLVQCYRQVKNYSITPFMGQMAFWLLLRQFHLGILHHRLHVDSSNICCCLAIDLLLSSYFLDDHVCIMHFNQQNDAKDRENKIFIMEQSKTRWPQRDVLQKKQSTEILSV